MPARLESYVEELRHELRDLPVTQCAEQLLEVRTHLDSLKSANLELGLTEEEAEAAAISQLGGSKTLGKQTRKANWKEQWDTIPGIAFIALMISTIIRMFPFSDIFANRIFPMHFTSIVLILIFTGIVINFLFPKKSKKGILLLLVFQIIIQMLANVVYIPQPVGLMLKQITGLYILVGVTIGSSLFLARKRGVA